MRKIYSRLFTILFASVTKAKRKIRVQKAFAICILIQAIFFLGDPVMAQTAFTFNDVGLISKVSSEINNPEALCTTFVGQINPADPTTNLRSWRDGIYKTCPSPGTCQPGTAGSFNYDILTWTSICATCVNITFSIPTSNPNSSFVTAFYAPPNLTNLCTSWMADPGTSAQIGFPITWSFNAPAGSHIIS